MACQSAVDHCQYRRHLKSSPPVFRQFRSTTFCTFDVNFEWVELQKQVSCSSIQKHQSLHFDGNCDWVEPQKQVSYKPVPLAPLPPSPPSSSFISDVAPAAGREFSSLANLHSTSAEEVWAAAPMGPRCVGAAVAGDALTGTALVLLLSDGSLTCRWPPSGAVLSVSPPSLAPPVSPLSPAPCLPDAEKWAESYNNPFPITFNIRQTTLK
jgi:hypothetical protein